MPDEQSTTSLGNWYATVILWRPQVALFVNETTLLPVLLPLAPAASVVDRFRASVAEVLREQGISRSFVEAEVAQMSDHRLATTKNRSVVGIMNEFTVLGDASREPGTVLDLGALSMWLARTPCGPLYGRHGSPDCELAAIVAQQRG